MGKSKSKSYHDFSQCPLRHQTTVKALGSLDSGFSLLMGLNSRLIRLHWNHLLLQTNICLCLDSTAGRRVFFSQGTSLIISFTPWVRALPLGQVCCFATMSPRFGSLFRLPYYLIQTKFKTIIAKVSLTSLETVRDVVEKHPTEHSVSCEFPALKNILAKNVSNRNTISKRR